LQKLNQLRTEADAATDRAEEAEARNKKLEQQLLEREQEISSLTHRLSLAGADNDKYEDQLKDLKRQVASSDSAGHTNEGLTRKVQLLEEELDASEKNLKETVEKCAFTFAIRIYPD
jgi:tropomyosin